MDKLKFETKSGAERNIERLAELNGLFPEVITEVKDSEGNLTKSVNFEKLKALLGEVVDSRAESYDFTWVGKRDALIEAGMPIRKTLRPVIEDETILSGADSEGKPYLSSGSVNWDTTQNLYIEGDNLDVLKLLTDSYLGKVKMIYIDPPYNTGKDFVYNDNHTMSQDDYDEGTERVDEDGNINFKENTVTNPKFHSDWCSMIYPRLKVARNLLSDDGVIFISIDDNEQINLRKICDEIFGESNFVANLIDIRSEGGGLAKQAVIGHDYIAAYAKNINLFVPLGKPKEIRGKIVEIDNEPYWIETDWLRKEFGKYGTCPYEEIEQWLGIKKKAEIDKGLSEKIYTLIPKEGYNIVGRYRKVADDTSKFYTIIKHLNKHGIEDLKQLGFGKYFDFPKPISLLKELILGATIRTKNKSDIILDFFSGSATTAHAVMQLNAEDGGNRKFICVQLPEATDEKSEAYKAGYKNICEIGKERVRRAGTKILKENSLTEQDLDIGFRVFKLDESNFEDVHFSAREMTQMSSFDSLVENLKDDRTDADLLYSCILEWGLSLSLPHTEEIIEGKKVFVVNGGDLIACFEESLPESVIKTIAERKPLNALFRESCFADSPAKINNEEIFKLISPSTKVKVL